MNDINSQLPNPNSQEARYLLSKPWELGVGGWELTDLLSLSVNAEGALRLAAATRTATIPVYL
jgi:hypothetical protein